MKVFLGKFNPTEVLEDPRDFLHQNLNLSVTISIELGTPRNFLPVLSVLGVTKLTEGS